MTTSTTTAGAASAPTSPVLSQTVGISPTQPVREGVFKVFGGTGEGGETYDLQTQNVYSLLQQQGVPIKNVLHPDSTAKPSFIVERLIVLSASGGSGGQANSQSNSSSSTSGRSSGPGAPSLSAGTTAQVQGPSDVERTITAVRRVVEAEISRGSGRIGGNHRRKLQFLRAAIVSIEQADQGAATMSGTVGGASDARSGSSSGAGNGQGQDKFDPRELFYGQARRYARQADRLAPKGF